MTELSITVKVHRYQIKCPLTANVYFQRFTSLDISFYGQEQCVKPG